MTDPHEALVEAVAQEIIRGNQGLPFNTAKRVIALIAERTKDATEDMCEEWSKAGISSRAEGDWIAMHRASPLWPKENAE